MTSQTQKNWRYSHPDHDEVKSVCKEIEGWANEQRWRIVSMLPVSGCLNLVSSSEGGTMTCGFVIVAEHEE